MARLVRVFIIAVLFHGKQIESRNKNREMSKTAEEWKPEKKSATEMKHIINNGLPFQYCALR